MALHSAMLELRGHGIDAEFELLTAGMTPSMNLPKIYPAQRYTCRKSLHLNSRTLCYDAEIYYIKTNDLDGDQKSIGTRVPLVPG